MSAKCSNCGAALADGDIFCNECGARIEKSAPPAAVFCEQCGTKNDAHDRFCKSCGSPLTVELSATGTEYVSSTVNAAAPKSSNKTVIAIVGGIAAFLVIAVAALMLRDAKRSEAEVSQDRAPRYDYLETGYHAIIWDDADLLSDEEEAQLLAVMKPITAYGHAVFSTDTNEAGRGTPDLAESVLRSVCPPRESGTIFEIDMENRMLYIYSDGAIHDKVTDAYALTITDNVYRHATAGRYFDCASEAFRQIRRLLDGHSSSQTSPRHTSSPATEPCSLQNCAHKDAGDSTASSAADEATATKIINDMRAAKSAALMIYMDEGQSWDWATQNNADRAAKMIDHYMDRPFFSGPDAHYSLLFTNDARVKATNGEESIRGLIGIRIVSRVLTSGVKKKLTENASRAGLYNADGSQYDGRDQAVYMILH